jgi:hypothetical protein
MTRDLGADTSHGEGCMALEILGIAIVAGVLGYVLYNHWGERYGDNHY